MKQQNSKVISLTQIKKNKAQGVQQQRQSGMEAIERAIAAWKMSQEDGLQQVLDAISRAVRQRATVWIPVVPNPEADAQPPYTRLTQQQPGGKTALLALTAREELEEGSESDVALADLAKLLQDVLIDDGVTCLIINPWGQACRLNKKMIDAIFRANLPENGENRVFFEVTQQQEGEKMYSVPSVAPVYYGAAREEKPLRNYYWNHLEQARALAYHSITFPMASVAKLHRVMQQKMAGIVIKTVSDWCTIYPHYGMVITVACPDQETAVLYQSVMQENQKAWNQRHTLYENNGMLEKALQFAMHAHRGQSLKGTKRPFLLHPLETLQILASMGADTNLMAAGVLHSTLEDTDVTLLELYDQFGVDVAALVNGHTADRRDVWYMSKLIHLERLSSADRRSKMLAMADQVAEMRTMLADYRVLGDRLWHRYHAPMTIQTWYYSRLMDVLSEMQAYLDTAEVYREMTGLYKELF